jgi:NAD(P)-dependent dehydrogenase (short-subunit alcohol dehydrogenase family)
MTINRSAIVTGSSRGIGRAIALALAQDGYAVTVNYANRADAADQVVKEIIAAGGEAQAVQGSVGRADDRQRLVDQTVQAFGPIEVLVNNAGITSPGRNDLLEATEEGWDQVFDTNLKGPFFLTQRVANHMRQAIGDGQLRRGPIVNVSSISAFAASTNRADYCMTKAAMQMMTWLFATRLAECNICVYEVCPGIIQTDMTAPVQEKYDRLIADGLTPIRRWGQPQDIAQTVATLARHELPFCTGERIHIDGGFHIRQL